MLIKTKHSFIKSNKSYIEKYVGNHYHIKKDDFDDAKRLFNMNKSSNDFSENMNIGTDHELMRVGFTSNCIFNTNDFIYHILSYVKENLQCNKLR